MHTHTLCTVQALYTHNTQYTVPCRSSAHTQGQRAVYSHVLSNTSQSHSLLNTYTSSEHTQHTHTYTVHGTSSIHTHTHIYCARYKLYTHTTHTMCTAVYSHVPSKASQRTAFCYQVCKVQVCTGQKTRGCMRERRAQSGLVHRLSLPALRRVCLVTGVKVAYGTAVQCIKTQISKNQ